MFDLIVTKQNQHAAMLQRIEDLLLVHLNQKMEQLMADVASLSAALDRLGGDLERIEKDLTDLKNKPGGISPADLDPVLAKINAMSDAVEAVDPAPAPPAPPANP